MSAASDAAGLAADAAGDAAGAVGARAREAADAAAGAVAGAVPPARTPAHRGALARVKAWWAVPPTARDGRIPSTTAALVNTEGDAAADRERGNLASQAALETTEAGWGDEAEAAGGLEDVREAVVGAGTHAAYKR